MLYCTLIVLFLSQLAFSSEDSLVDELIKEVYEEEYHNQHALHWQLYMGYDKVEFKESYRSLG